MKNNLTLQVMGLALSHMTKDVEPGADTKQISAEYHRILARSKDIGRQNPLLSSYSLAAWFIAMNRVNPVSPERNCEILSQGMRRSRMFRAVMGDAEHYLDPKRTEKRKEWAKSTHRRVYENDWVLDLLPGNGQYDLGYDYLECGVCKLCRDEGCPEFAKYLCSLDFVIADIMGLRLERTTTLAEGGEKCDFRYSRK